MSWRQFFITLGLGFLLLGGVFTVSPLLHTSIGKSTSLESTSHKQPKHESTSFDQSRLAQIHFGPVEAVEKKIEELDELANEHWFEVYENQCDFPGGPKPTECLAIPQKVRDYWENNPGDAPDPAPPAEPTINILNPGNNHDTNVSPMPIRGEIGGNSDPVNVGDSVTIRVDGTPSTTVQVVPGKTWSGTAGVTGLNQKVDVQLHDTGPGDPVIKSDTITVNFDDTPETVQINSPKAGLDTTAMSVDLSGTVSDGYPEGFEVQVWNQRRNDTTSVSVTENMGDSDWIRTGQKLESDTNTLTVKITDQFGNVARDTIAVISDTKPRIFDEDGDLEASDGVNFLQKNDLDGDSTLSATVSHDISILVRQADTVSIVFAENGTAPDTDPLIDGEDTAIRMNNVGMDKWEGTIPDAELNTGENVRFMIHAKQLDGDTTIADSAGDFYRYTTTNEYVGPLWMVNKNVDANDRWATAGGNDSNRGDTANPFATIQKALDKAAPGHRVRIDADTYNEGGTIPDPDPPLDNLIIEGASSETAVINRVSGLQPRGLLKQNGSAYADSIIIRNLKIRGATVGIDISNVRDSLFENLLLTRNTTGGIIQNSINSVIRNNLVQRNVSFGLSIAGSELGNNGNKIVRNTVIDNTGVTSGGSIFGVTGRDQTVRNNVIANNGNISGLQVASEQSLYSQNLITNNDSHGIVLTSFGDEENVIVQNDVVGAGGVYFAVNVLGFQANDTITKNNLFGGLNKEDDAEGLFAWRNFLGTTDSSSISTELTPFRLGKVDTAVGADTLAPASPDTVAADSISIGPSNDQVRISWADVTHCEEDPSGDSEAISPFPGGSGSCQLEQYRVYRSPSSPASDWKSQTVACTTSPGVTSCLDPVGGGLTYYYKVTGVDDRQPLDASSDFENESFVSDQTGTATDS